MKTTCHLLVSETKQYLVEQLIENHPEVKAIREREPTAEEVARYAETRMDELCEELVQVRRRACDLLEMHRVSVWFQSLEIRQAKLLLSLLHDARTHLESTTDPVRMNGFYGLLNRLEAEYGEMKVEQAAFAAKKEP